MENRPLLVRPQKVPSSFVSSQLIHIAFNLCNSYVGLSHVECLKSTISKGTGAYPYISPKKCFCFVVNFRSKALFEEISGGHNPVIGV